MLTHKFKNNKPFHIYNKDILDMYAVSYPEDGMTWDEVIDLARSIAGRENDEPYYALDPGIPNFIPSQMSLPLINYETNKSAINTEQWSEFFTLFQTIMEIPPGETALFQSRRKFTEDENLALFPDFGSLMGSIVENENLRWDMVSYPVFADNPGVGLRTDSHIMMISSTSEYREEAFQAMIEIMGEENQLAMSRSGRLSSLSDSKFQENVGADVPELDDKNIQDAFLNDSAPIHPSNSYTQIALAQINPALINVLEGETDINSALREAEEIANNEIEELMMIEGD